LYGARYSNPARSSAACHTSRQKYGHEAGRPSMWNTRLVVSARGMLSMASTPRRVMWTVRHASHRRYATRRNV
jgi:hypothetical protein